MFGFKMKLAIGVTAAALAFSTLGCTKEQGSEKAFCREVANAPTIDSVVSGFTDADQGELDKRLADAAEAYDDIAKAAPGEIRGDVDTVVRLVDAVIDAVKDHSEDPEVVAEQVRNAVVDNPGSIKAAASIAIYAANNCNLELNPTVEDGPTSSTTSTTTP